MSTLFADLYPLTCFGQYIEMSRLTQAEKTILCTPNGDTPQYAQGGTLLIVASLSTAKIASIQALHLHDGGAQPRQLVQDESLPEA